MSLETSEGLLEAIGTQALSGGSYHSAEETSKNIDNVSLTDVANVRRFVSTVILPHWTEINIGQVKTEHVSSGVY